MNLFSNGSIKTRIFVGFTIVTSFILILSYVSLQGNKAIEKSFNDYDDITRISRQMLLINKAVADLQKSVQDFVYTGYAAVAERAQMQIRNLSIQLDLCSKEFPQTSKALNYVKQLQRHLKTYNENFNFAIEERKKRRQLVETLEQSLVAFKKDLKIDSPLHYTLVSAEKNLYEYLRDPNILKINESINSLNAQIHTTGNREHKNYLTTFRGNFIEIVQSTRGFLFLIAVVMAAETQEFSYVSALLKNLVLSQIEPLKEKVSAKKNSTQQTITIASAVLFILAAILSLGISASISTPLAKLTQTFNSLAKGQEVKSIPGLEWQDEIGEMAQAAEVFRQKNNEMVHLFSELDKQKKALERSNDELDQFVYTVSHDLKSPIVTSMGFIGLMQDLAQQGKHAEVLKKLPILEQANRRMSQLIDDLLALSRVEKTSPEAPEIDIKKLLEEIFKLHQREFSVGGIQAEIIGDLPNLKISESRALQLFDNLITNAIKYCTNNQGPKITVGCQSSDQTHSFFVRDNGPGILKEYHEKVFTLFQRLQNDNKGTGIGLSIVQKIMKANGGHVWIESGVGIEGCTFWLEFPKLKEVA